MPSSATAEVYDQRPCCGPCRPLADARSAAPCPAGMSTPKRVNSHAGISSDTRDLLALHAPMTGGSFKESQGSSGKYKQLSEMHADEGGSNGSLYRERKRSRTMLTVVGPPVIVTKFNAQGQPEEPRFVHGSIRMLKVRRGRG